MSAIHALPVSPVPLPGPLLSEEREHVTSPRATSTARRSGVWKLITATVFTLALPWLAGCTAGQPSRLASADEHGFPAITITHAATAEGLGAGQGVAVHDGFVYLYGDAATGVIRQYRFEPPPDVLAGERFPDDAGPAPRLVPTGVEIKLTKDGKDLVSHPTGLTFNPQPGKAGGAFLGDTVKGVGMIYYLNWSQALKDGNLDNAVLNVIRDDAAVNGTRPEYVKVGDRWLIATADYGNLDNAVRLYDPAKLATAKATTEPGVMLASYPCGPWVQTLHHRRDAGQLVLVQNQVAGLLYRLTAAKLNGGLKRFKRMDADYPRDELEGFAFINEQWCVFFSSSPKDNVWFGRIHGE